MVRAMELDNRLYYQVTAWMINDLHLKGKELQCYAVIYSLSQLGQGWYNAGLDFLSKFMQVSQPTASSAIDGLLKKGLIDKKQIIVETGRRVVYFCKGGDNKNIIDGVNKNFIDGVNKNFIDTNKNNIIDNKNKGKSVSNDTQKRGEFKRPSVQEVDDYIKEKGLHFDAEHFVNYYQSIGWKVGNHPMKDWKAACQTWERKRKSQEKEKEEKENPDTSSSDWDAQKRWLEKNTPNIAGRMTKEMLRRFKEFCMCDSYLLADTLREFDKIYDGGDMMKEFEELCKKR